MMPSPPTAAGPSFLDERKALACVHCGLCLSSCPTYLETGNENDSPRGRIHLMRALESGRLPLNDATVRHLDLCLGCRACESACPSGVQYGDLLEAAREHIEARHPRGPLQTILRRWVIRHLFPFPERLEIALLPARLLLRTGGDRWLPPRLREVLELLPRPSNAMDPSDGDSAPTRLRLPALSPASGPVRRGRVGLITGCVMQVLFARTHLNTLRLLNAAGYDVVIPSGQGCCGALHAHSGYLADARRAAHRNVHAFAGAGPLDAIVVNSAGCGSLLKEYGSLLRGDPSAADPAMYFASRVRDLTEILVAADGFLEGLAALARQTDEPPSVAAPRSRVTCHDACHLLHAQRVAEPPRRILRVLAGDRFVELPEADVCCGSAGTYNLTEPAMARRLQARKVDHIRGLGPVTVVTTNPGCLLQIQAGLRATSASQTRVEHIADWLAAFLPLPAKGSVDRPRTWTASPWPPR